MEYIYSVEIEFNWTPDAPQGIPSGLFLLRTLTNSPTKAIKSSGLLCQQSMSRYILSGSNECIRPRWQRLHLPSEL